MPYRDGRVLGQLEVSRSLGDGQFKAHGVVPTPDLRKATLGPSDRYALLACDGLWKAFTAPAAVSFVADQRTKLEAEASKIPDLTAPAREVHPPSRLPGTRGSCGWARRGCGRASATRWQRRPSAAAARTTSPSSSSSSTQTNEPCLLVLTCSVCQFYSVVRYTVC